MNGRRDTAEEFAAVKRVCRDLFEKKMYDYGTSWRIMRPSSLTDQIMIKARRIRSLEEKGGVGRIAEGVEQEYIGIINYCVMALVQLAEGPGEELTPERTMQLYDYWFDSAAGLMTAKNHDYDEAWRDMLVTSLTDIILQKLHRTRRIELHNGETLVSEGIDANYMDIINYAVFALIKLGIADTCKKN